LAGAGGIVGVIDQRVAREDDPAVGERQRPVAREYADREIDRLGPWPAGFARAPAEKVLRGVLRESPAAPVEELIRMALKKL